MFFLLLLQQLLPPLAIPNREGAWANQQLSGEVWKKYKKQRWNGTIYKKTVWKWIRLQEEVTSDKNHFLYKKKINLFLCYVIKFHILVDQAALISKIDYSECFLYRTFFGIGNIM